MSELKLREFGLRAEELVTLPDLADLERRGRDLRRRRVAAVGVAAAFILAVVGITALKAGTDKATEPAPTPDDRSLDGRIYPGESSTMLHRGQYWIDTSYPEYPLARFTLPKGWISSGGPTRYDGLAPGRITRREFQQATWYAAMQVERVEAVSSRVCKRPRAGDEVGSSADELVRAITRIPGFRVETGTGPVSMYGYPATHLRLVRTAATRACADENYVFATGPRPIADVLGPNQDVLGGHGDREDVWVVDVDGHPVLVDAQWMSDTPPAIRQELSDIIDSIEFHSLESAAEVNAE